MNSCGVCIEKYNRSTRLSIVCNSCEYSACRNCYEQYIETSEMMKICCMSCKIEWDDLDISNKFTNKFINNYNKQLGVNMLFQKEIQLFPGTQPLVEEILRRREFDKKIKEYTSEICNINMKISNLTEEYKRDMQKIQNKKFTIRRCIKDSCRGYLSNDWICGLCETQCCSQCHFEMESDHVCNAENIKTAKVINENGRPCPNCSTIIFKSDGCDQMYCTICKTPFSWTTGKIVNGVIHNPHHLEEMQNPERNLLEVRCGREIDQIFANNLKTYVRMYFNEHAEKILLSICLNIIVMRLELLPKFINVRTDNSDLRISYLMGELSEEQFKITLQKRDKENKKRKRIAQILNMYINSATEIFYRLLNYMINCKKDIFDPLKELSGLIDYTNNCFEEIKTVYKCKAYLIDKWCGELVRG